VLPGRLVRGVRVAAGDRVDDREVLAEGLPGPAGALRELELVPDELRVQPVKQGDRDGLPGDEADGPVQLLVGFRVLERVPVGHAAPEPVAKLPQAGDLLVGGVRRGLDGAQRL
jgi:hypothetical protein